MAVDRTDLEDDLELTSGRVHLRRWGRASDPVALCLHGLTANLTAFDWFAEGLVRRGVQVVAIDFRGRGKSDITPSGTYGMHAHADDVLEILDRLDSPVHLVGWSMGALVAITVAARGTSAIGNVVLIDHVGPMSAEAIEVVTAATARLDAQVSQPQDFVDAIRSRGIIDPWTPFWSDHYTYELGSNAIGTWTPTTSREACLEDLSDAIAIDWPSLWASMSGPTTLIRCVDPVGGALLVDASTRDRFLAAVPHVELVEVPANHYTVMTDPDALAMIAGSTAQ